MGGLYGAVRAARPRPSRAAAAGPRREQRALRRAALEPALLRRDPCGFAFSRRPRGSRLGGRADDRRAETPEGADRERAKASDARRAELGSAPSGRSAVGGLGLRRPRARPAPADSARRSRAGSGRPRPARVGVLRRRRVRARARRPARERLPGGRSPAEWTGRARRERPPRGRRCGARDRRRWPRLRAGGARSCRSRRSERPEPGALGLGLYTAERIARASGGSLRRENRESGGAVVRLFLPLVARPGGPQ